LGIRFLVPCVTPTVSLSAVDQRDALLDRILSPLRIHLGINRLKTAAGWDGHASVPKELREELLYLDRRSEDAGMGENAADSASWDRVRSFGNLRDRPLIVLTAGKPYDPDPLLSREESDRQDEMWINVLQAEEARLSTRGKQIVVPASGHIIPYERPASVVSAVREGLGGPSKIVVDWSAVTTMCLVSG
ncbi:MAG: hypothetical protein WB676_08675, partial [Bryobacteraceae bacterium]